MRPGLLVLCQRNRNEQREFSNPTNAVGGSFILSLQRRLMRARPESHQRSWWIVHTLPTETPNALQSRNQPSPLAYCLYPDHAPRNTVLGQDRTTTTSVGNYS